MRHNKCVGQFQVSIKACAKSMVRWTTCSQENKQTTHKTREFTSINFSIHKGLEMLYERSQEASLWYVKQ